MSKSPADSDTELNPEDVVSGMHSVYEAALGGDSEEPSEDEIVVEDDVVAPKAEAPAANESWNVSAASEV